ncbi:MAG: ABC transporter permease [Saprospiraceae bacterium]|nr:ABC transporter permease [Saprospiraceae bacterium]
MFFNYFKIAFRQLKKNRLFSFTNIAGLSIGVASCLLILLFIAYELSFDRWIPRIDQIVRPHAEINFGGNEDAYPFVGSIVGPDAAAQLPEIEAWARVRTYGGYLVKVDQTDQQNALERRVMSVDNSFLNLFSLNLLAGDPGSALNEPNTLVISKTTAEKYFNSVDAALGKSLLLDNKKVWKVNGVYADIPPTTHFQADLLLSLAGNEEIKQESPLWATSNNFYTYFLLRDGVDYDSFKEKFLKLSRDKISITSSQLLGMSLEEFEATGQYARMDLDKVADIHLYSKFGSELTPGGNIRYIYIFGAIALFILLIACINFMNLTTAKSAQRSMEIGVRKVMGSTKQNLVTQFLSESFLMSFIAVVIAVLIAFLALPSFNELTARHIGMPWEKPLFWISLIAGILVTGFLAGSYPAIVLARFDPIRALKGQKSKAVSRINLRSVLVVFQFMIAIVLIVGSIMIYRQLNYIQHKDLGFNKEQVLIINNTYALGDQVQSFKNRVLSQPSVSSATVSSYLPVPSSYSNSTYSKSREFRQDQSINMQEWRVDYDYAKTLDLKMDEGRFFDQKFPTDSFGVVINEAAAKILNYPEPLGQKIYGITGQLSHQPQPEDFTEYTIIGVVKDFNWQSLHDKIGALSMFLEPSQGLVSIRYQADDSKALLTAIENIWKEMAPTQPFSYRFMDESFSRMYEAEQRIGKIALIFAFLAILVSCLGLFGLTHFVTELRRKEIGIRKVLGATTESIVQMLNREFIVLVLIAMVIATPIAWYAMNRWLSDFAYRVNISWWIFALAGLIALGIALLTVSFQSLKAALANPVNSIKSE